VRAEKALATARHRTEAVVEIDSVGLDRDYPHCGSVSKSSRGVTRAGTQRWGLFKQADYACRRKICQQMTPMPHRS